MKSVLEILKEIRPEFDFSASNDFMADGMLDSFDMVTLVAALDKNYEISIQAPKSCRKTSRTWPRSKLFCGNPECSMNFRFHNKRIAGVLTVVPRNERSFLEEMRELQLPGRTLVES